VPTAVPTPVSAAMPSAAVVSAAVIATSTVASAVIPSAAVPTTVVSAAVPAAAAVVPPVTVVSITVVVPVVVVVVPVAVVPVVVGVVPVIAAVPVAVVRAVPGRARRRHVAQVRRGWPGGWSGRGRVDHGTDQRLAVEGTGPRHRIGRRAEPWLAGCGERLGRGLRRTVLSQGRR
jgi:hypothetical protein